MSVEFKHSETRTNLMKAFAGESQARNRYTFAAKEAKNQKLHIVEAVFTFTASQEEAHAKVFYDHLKALSGENIQTDGTYPVDISNSIEELLRYAQHNEYEEYNNVYKSFADTARIEGFLDIAADFTNISEIEKIHGDRLGHLADLIKSNKLFVADVECKWMCLNCGFVYSGKEAPKICPVCSHDQGFFIRLELAPYTKN